MAIRRKATRKAATYPEPEPKPTTAKPPAADRYEEGFRDCARAVKQELDLLWFQTPRAIRPNPFMTWLAEKAASDEGAEDNAKVEGEDAE